MWAEQLQDQGVGPQSCNVVVVGGPLCPCGAPFILMGLMQGQASTCTHTVLQDEDSVCKPLGTGMRSSICLQKVPSTCVGASGIEK